MSDDNLERITILLQAKDRDFARAMDRNNKLIHRMTRESDRNMQRMNRSVSSNLDQMGTSALAMGRNFVIGLGAGVATAALGALTTGLRQTVRSIASIGDEARRSGLDAESFQEWAFVAERNRIGVDQLVDGFKELNLRADEFIVTGGGAAAEAFARLGYDSVSLARDLEDPSELMLELIGRMGDLDRAAQIRVSDEIFGGSAGERFVELLDRGERGLRRTIAAAHDAGAVFDSEMIQRATILDQKFADLTTRVRTFLQTAAVGLFAGGVETPADSLERIFGTLERARAALGDGIFDAVISEAGELEDTSLEAISGISAGFERAQVSIGRVTAGMSDITGQLADLGRVDELLSFDEVIHELDQLVADFRAGAISAGDFDENLRDAVTRATQALIAVNAIDGVDISDAVTAISALTGELGRARAEAQALSSELPGGGDSLGMTSGTPFVDPDIPFMPPTGEAPRTSIRPRRAPSLLGEPGPDGGGGGVNGYAASVADIQARTRALELEAAALVAVAEGGRDYGDAVEYARTRAALMNQALAEGHAITPQLQAEIDDLAAAYVAAGESAEAAAAQMDRIQHNAERGASAATDVLMAMAEGGDAARQAVMRLVLEMIRLRIESNLLGAAGKGGGIGGLLGLLGGALTRRAGGGPMRAGVPHLVNENTPNSEIIVPSRSGGILNVAQAKDALRSSPGDAVGLAITVNVEGANGDQHVIDLVRQGVSAGLGAYDRTMPGRVAQIQRRPRDR